MTHDNNVQVLATTHSWDCVRGFARATTALDGAAEPKRVLTAEQKYDL